VPPRSPLHGLLMRPLFAERPEISVKVARDPPIQAWGRACLSLVLLNASLESTARKSSQRGNAVVVLGKISPETP
jgi:hypothetical protein